MIKSCNSTLEKSHLIRLVKWAMSNSSRAGDGDTWEPFFLYWMAPVCETEGCHRGLWMVLWVCSQSASHSLGNCTMSTVFMGPRCCKVCFDSSWPNNIHDQARFSVMLPEIPKLLRLGGGNGHESIVKTGSPFLGQLHSDVSPPESHRTTSFVSGFMWLVSPCDVLAL